MKAILIVIALILVVGCASGLCPKKPVFFYGNTPIGLIPYRIPPGYFNDPDNFWTEEEWKQRFSQQRPAPEPESMEPDFTI